MESQDQVDKKSDGQPKFGQSLDGQPEDNSKEKQSSQVDQQQVSSSQAPQVQDPIIQEEINAEETKESVKTPASKASAEHDKQQQIKGKTGQTESLKLASKSISNNDQGIESNQQLKISLKASEGNQVSQLDKKQAIADDQTRFIGQLQKQSSQSQQIIEQLAPQASVNGESTDNDNENENDQTFIYEPNQQKGPEDTTIVEEKHHKKSVHNDDVVRQTSQQMANQTKEESKSHSPQKLNKSNEPILNISIQSQTINKNDQNKFTIQQQQVQNIINQHANQSGPSQIQQIKNMGQNQVQHSVQPNNLAQQPIQQMSLSVQPQVQKMQSQAPSAGQIIQPDASAQEGEQIEEVDQDDSDEEEIPQQFVDESPSGRFKRFDEELGRGAYKTVYRGVDHDTGREVAWSIISLGRLPKAERPRIKSEINIIKQLKNPNIINFISAWICREKDQIHFITEMITGGSLRQYLKRMVKPKLKVIKNWCIEILKGLNYLHTYQINGVTTPIIHRDIKCDNVFINSNSGEIKIGDLGLSTTMKNSYTSSVLGTPEFMAPELYEECYGTEVDIYAFGMALLEMITMEAPYKECQNPAQIYRKVVNRDYPQSLLRIQDDQVKEFIMRCIDDRENRPSAMELLNSEFMMDSTSKNNSIPCAISEVPKAKAPKKKLIFKNNMEGIPEEEEHINDEQEIKDQNKGLVELSNTEMTTANLKAHQEDSILQQQSSQQTQPGTIKQTQNLNLKKPSSLQPQQIMAPQQEPAQLQKNKAEYEKISQQSLQVNQKSESIATLSTHQPQNLPQDNSMPTSPTVIPDSIGQHSSDGQVDIKKVVDIVLAQEGNKAIKSTHDNVNKYEEKDEENDRLNQTMELFDKLNDNKEKQQNVIADSSQPKATSIKPSQDPELKSPSNNNRQFQPQDQSQYFVDGAQNNLDQQIAQNLDENLQRNNTREKVSSSQHAQVKKSIGEQDKNFFEKKSNRKNTDVQDQRPSNKEEHRVIPSKNTSQDKQEPPKIQAQPKMILSDLQKELEREDRKKLQQEKDALKQSMIKIQEKGHPQSKAQSKHEPNGDKSVGAQPKGDTNPKKEPKQPENSSKPSHKTEEVKESKDPKTQASKPKEKHSRAQKPSDDPQAIQNPQDAKNPKQKNDIDRKVKIFKEDEFEGQGKAITAGSKISSSSNLIQLSLNQQHNKEKAEGKNVLTPTGQKKTDISNQVNQSKGHKRETEDPAKVKQHEAQKKQQIQNMKEIDVKKRTEPQVNLSSQQKQVPQENKKEPIKQKQSTVQMQQNADHKLKEKPSSSNLTNEKQQDWVHIEQNRKKNKVSAEKESEIHIPESQTKKLEKPMHSEKTAPLKQFPPNMHQDKHQLNQSQGQSGHIQSKKVDDRKTQDTHVIQKETEKIQMKFEVLGHEVSFDYNLRRDTPEVVAREFVNEMKFENPTDSQEYFITFKEKIEKQLEKYGANKSLQKKPPKKQAQPETPQVVQQSPQQQIQVQANLQEQEQKVGHPQKKESTQHPSKPSGNTQHVKSNTQHHANVANSSRDMNSGTPGTGATGSQIPDYHTEEFLKKRDDFKAIYKGMNTAIKKFFTAMNNEGMDIDKVLDVMDYVDEGDRAYKKNFIQSLQTVHRNFLNKEKLPINKLPSNEVNLGQSNKQGNQAQDKKQSALNMNTANILSQSHQQMNLKAANKLNAGNQLSQSQTIQKPQDKMADKPQQDNAKIVESKQSKQKDQSSSSQQQTQGKQQATKKTQKEVNSKKSGEINMIDVQKTINSIKAAYKTGRDIDSNQNLQNPSIQPLNPQSESLAIEVDGIYGEQTQNEIKRIQEKLSIEQDGIINNSLISKMDELLERLKFKNEQKIDLIKKQQKQPQSQQQLTHQQQTSNNNQVIDQQQKNQAQKEPNYSQKLPIDKDNQIEQILPEKKQIQILNEQALGAKKSEQEHDENVEQQEKVKIKVEPEKIQEEEEKQVEDSSGLMTIKSTQLTDQIFTQSKMGDFSCEEQIQNEKNGVYNFAEGRMAEPAEKEEQGSSGTNPLSKKDHQFHQEYDADLDQTQITMNSKEDKDGGDTSSEATNITQHSIQQQQNHMAQSQAVGLNNEQPKLNNTATKEDQHSPQNGSQKIQGNNTQS